jgi:hypothetical protein
MNSKLDHLISKSLKIKLSSDMELPSGVVTLLSVDMQMIEVSYPETNEAFWININNIKYLSVVSEKE